MNVIVTGAAGFLGSHLCEAFLAQGHAVFGIDNFFSGRHENLEDLRKQKKFRFLEADIVGLSPEAYESESLATFNGARADRIFHFACPASPPVYQKDPLFTLDTCYLGSRNALAAAERMNARILLASTSEIYGDPDCHPQPESYWGNVNSYGPRSCYDEGKRVMETLGLAFQARGVAVRIVRIFNTYGPRMSPGDGRVLTNFITQALRGDPLTVYGDGAQTRSFCYVDDLVRGLGLLMESGVTSPVNLGSEFEHTILEMATTVKSATGSKAPIVHEPLPTDDPKQRRPDISKARRDLGWEPRVSLQEGMEKMIGYLRRYAR
jgi:UDP-glucuronate decarboxylase